MCCFCIGGDGRWIQIAINGVREMLDTQKCEVETNVLFQFQISKLLASQQVVAAREKSVPNTLRVELHF